MSREKGVESASHRLLDRWHHTPGQVAGIVAGLSIAGLVTTVLRSGGKATPETPREAWRELDLGIPDEDSATVGSDQAALPPSGIDK